MYAYQTTLYYLTENQARLTSDSTHIDRDYYYSKILLLTYRHINNFIKQSLLTLDVVWPQETYRCSCKTHNVWLPTTISNSTRDLVLFTIVVICLNVRLHSGVKLFMALYLYYLGLE